MTLLQILNFISSIKETMGIRWNRKSIIIVGVVASLSLFILTVSLRSSSSASAELMSNAHSVRRGNIQLENNSRNSRFQEKGHSQEFVGEEDPLAVLRKQGNEEKPHTHKHTYSVWPEFSSSPEFSNDFLLRECVGHIEYSITGLVKLNTEWSQSTKPTCRQSWSTFSTIYELEGRKAPLLIPALFESKVRRWLGNKEKLMKEVYNQDVVHVVSRFTREHTIFNPIRDKRPVMPLEVSEKKYLEDIVNETSQSCDFCKFKDYTAEHTFGRIESKYSFSASNIFKLDTLHAIIALKAHHPLDWNYEQFMDIMSLTNQWLDKAKRSVPTAKFPSLIWDVLPKCGASQVHPHMHVVFDPHRYHGEVEAWRHGGQDYFEETGRNYFTDLIATYTVLNLTVTHGDAVAFANLVPRKDHEVVIMSKTANDEFFSLVYYVLRGLVDDLGKMCFSMGMGLPPYGEESGHMPAYARVITRGAITDIRADMSSLELFMATNVNIDPWKTISVVRESVKKRKQKG